MPAPTVDPAGASSVGTNTNRGALARSHGEEARHLQKKSEKRISAACRHVQTPPISRRPIPTTRGGHVYTPKTSTYQQAEVAVMPTVNGDCMRLRALWTALGRVSDDGIPSGRRQYRAVCAAAVEGIPTRSNFKEVVPSLHAARCKLQEPKDASRACHADLAPSCREICGGEGGWIMKSLPAWEKPPRTGRILRDSGPGTPPVIIYMWGG